MSDRNVWADALIGMAAGAVGTAVMGQYFRVASQLQQATGNAEAEAEVEGSGDAGGNADAGGRRRLDDVALTSIERHEDENATTTLARVVHHGVTGADPSDARKQKMGQAVHWAMGMSMGGIYGLTRGQRDGLDIGGGLVFGASVWAAADEVMVPVLGLSRGPTAHSPGEHLNGLGAHLVFGMATALAAQSMARLT